MFLYRQISGMGGLTVSEASEVKITRKVHLPDHEDGGKTCLKYYASDPFSVGHKYGSIPANLLTNTVVWLVLIVLFFIVHKNVMGKLFSSSKKSTHWTEVLFRRQTSSSPEEEEEARLPHTDKEVRVVVREEKDTVVIDKRQSDIEEDSATNLMENARVLTLREKKLTGIMGPDAVQYLRFQKYIIIYVLFTTILSCSVILPLNLQGSHLDNSTDFGHTTLANLDPKNSDDDNILWVHVVLGFLMFPAAIFLMRRFSYGLKMTDTSLKVTRTLGIENIPELLCSEDYLLQHFSEAYPDFPVQDIRLVHNVARLYDLQLQLENVLDSIQFCRKYQSKHSEELDMVPVPCSRCCGFFCLLCVGKVNSLEFFLQEKVMPFMGQRLCRKSFCSGPTQQPDRGGGEFGQEEQTWDGLRHV